MACFLVTGAAGFIGAKVWQFLLEAGHDVVGMDNLNTAYDPRLRQWRLELPGRHRLSRHRVEQRRIFRIAQEAQSRIQCVLTRGPPLAGPTHGAPAVKLVVVAAEDEQPEQATGDWLNGVERMTAAS
jgi:nucleoside-diphosphate-sugar epimerase